MNEQERKEEQVKLFLVEGDIPGAARALTTLHPADRADLFLSLSQDAQRLLLEKLDFSSTAKILEELEGEDAAQVASELPTETLAQVLGVMSPDSAADVLGELPEEQASSALAQMEEPEEVTELLKYEDDTAGGLMIPVSVALQSNQTVDEGIKTLREAHPDSGAPYYLYALSADGKLEGVISLRDLITADPKSVVSSLMNRDVKSISVHADQEELAQEITHYGLLAFPVVDDTGKLLGVVRSQDVAQVIEEEATEDIYHLAGISSEGDSDLSGPLRESIKRRLPWLMINLGTAFLAAGVVKLFEATLAKAAILAAFLGVIAGQGGNAGTQTLTIVVRGLALGEVSIKDVWKALAREMILGAINGITVGIAVGLGAYFWVGDAKLGLVAALALLGNLIAAAISGTLIPLGLRAAKIDPAMASGVLVTTVTDCVGFGLFLWLATVILY